MATKIDYSSKQALVIDASSTVRSSTMAILSELGLKHIKGSTTSDRALELVANNPFDLVLVGNSTSERLTGLQLLERAKYQGLIKSSACWGFMASDNSSDILLHAAQIAPDFMIAKPFSASDLANRLNSIMQRKQALKPINGALDAGNAAKAVDFCSFILTKNADAQLIKQLKADLLLQEGDFAQAQVLLEEINKQQPRESVAIKLCEALIGQRNYNLAMPVLEKLLAKNPMLLKAYDLKAQIFEARGEIERARDALREAVRLTSLAIPRNLKLGKFALNTGELKLAESVFKRSIALNDSSYFRSPEPFIGLANVRRAELKLDDTETQQCEQRIEALLKGALTNFPEDQELRVQVALFRSQLQQDLNNEEASAKYRELARRIVTERSVNQDLDALMQLALSEIPQAEPTRSLEEEPAPKKQEPAMSNKANLQGIKQYLAQNTVKAAKYFTMAIELDRENCSALLNLVQVNLESLHRDVAGRDRAIKLVSRYLSLVENVEKSTQQEQRYAELRAHFKGGIQRMPAGSLAVPLR
ncbi:MAG: tetratricopeptide repeat protein [Pseudomonadales bacterium]